METRNSSVITDERMQLETPRRSRLHSIAIKTAINVLPFWWVLVLAVGVSVITSVWLSNRIASTTHTLHSTLIYHPLPIDGSAHGMYSPPDLKTLTSLVNSGPVLQRAIVEANDVTTPYLLSKNLTVVDPRNTQRVGLFLATEDPDQGRRTLAAICESAQNLIAEMRKDVVGATLQELHSSVERNVRRLKAAKEDLLRFTGRLEIEDVETEMIDLANGLASLEYRLKSTQIEEKGLRVQHKIVANQLAEQKKEAERELAAEDKSDAAPESLMDARRRQDRLNELIREERRLNEVRARLDARQNEFARKMQLYEKGYISRSDFESIESSVKELQAQVMEGTKIAEWKIEMDRLDKIVVPKAGRKTLGSPILQQTMFKLFELDLQVNNAQEVQRQIILKQADLRKRRQELRLFQKEQNGLQQEIQAANDERDTLNRQTSSLTSLHEMGPAEFTVAEAPSGVMQRPSSNRAKLFAAIFAGMLILSTAPILLLAAIAAARPTVLERAQELNLVVLSPRKSLSELMRERRTDRGLTWERQIALRIQQLIPRRGSVVTIVPAHARAGDHQMVRDVAQILEQREENILIVHLGNSSGVDADIVSSRLLNKVTAEFGQQIPTLADFLVDADVTANQTIGRTTDGAHLVNGGQYDEELIFSQRMSEYMAHISGEYSIVLVYGMDMAETTNVEMLAGHSQGIIFLHDRTDLLSGDIRRTMDNLCEIQAPLFGIAMRPSQPTFFQHRRSARAAARQSKVDAGKVGNQRARKSVDHEMSGTVKPANELASVVANEINVVENGKELP